MVQINFDIQSAPEEKARVAVPEGDYKVMITDSDSRTTKAGTGSYLALTLQIVEGEYKGVPLFENLNLENVNEKAVQIAKARLRSYCEATNTPVLNDTQQLHGKPFMVRVSVEKNEEYGDQNRIKRVSANGVGGTVTALKPKKMSW